MCKLFKLNVILRPPRHKDSKKKQQAIKLLKKICRFCNFDVNILFLKSMNNLCAFVFLWQYLAQVKFYNQTTY